ncbi:glycosyltransferase family 4 protein [Sphingobium sp. CECT 9361]|uniref:glycosyltransferase family 4 protein n=1 Tax=Sphingobium sp. CECT 9361 TaxID=2845384 RepID=UPI001E4FF5BC|nr:glycosyltransferase family 4 protein [Sphingobium sp. CECT 9361]CAH0356465.1 D-inositol-3-phosphate glycosyltransferase [Sphingobium sp. CECT 9361]|tara:strand:- start:17303 stop:18571 length:1269 start_codon:yes stop_codon:yes gene_type:complete
MTSPFSNSTTPVVSQDFPTFIEGQPLANKKILIIVENLPLPFDRRVWQEARTLKAAGATVSIICPIGKGYEKRYELLEGVHIYRHPLPVEASSALGYLYEYGAALFWETCLAWKIFFTRGLDVIHGCNPPDLIFLVALPFRLFGVRFLFDHHDINPELYEAKFNRRGFFWKLMVLFERMTFATASVSIATNQSYRAIALERGRMKADKVFVVRSGPDLSRLRVVPPVESWKNGRAYLVGYVGVMGDQEGIDLLIDAVDHLVKISARTDIQFCLIGGGPSLANLQTLVAERGLDDFITFTGRAPDQTLFEVLSTMDLGVNPDRVNTMNDKSTMNKIMEYMALGKPMVQFDVAEGRFSAMDASLYAKANDPIDLAQKIVDLIDDPERRARMGAYGRDRVEKELSWPHQIEPLLSAYKKILRLDR